MELPLSAKGRRVVLGAIGLAWLIASPVCAHAQRAERVIRLAVLAPSELSRAAVHGFVMPELERLGFALGRNLVLIERVGDHVAMPGLARDVVRAGPDAVLSIANPAALAIRAATTTIPVVNFGADLVGLGLASSMSRPNGNMTGVMVLSTEIEPKRLELLAEAVPLARRLGALLHVSTAKKQDVRRQLQVVADERQAVLTIIEVAELSDYDTAFSRFRQNGVQALLIAAHALLFRDSGVLIQKAEAARLATICEWPEMAEQGCVLGYGPSRRILYQRAAAQLADIFRGAAPGGIPIESPPQLKLSVNIKAARALDLVVPATLLARADEVIE